MTTNRILEAIRNRKIRCENYLKAKLILPASINGLKTIMA